MALRGARPALLAALLLMVSMGAGCLDAPHTAGLDAGDAIASPMDAGPEAKQLLANPGFDLGAVDWTQDGGTIIYDSADVAVRPDSGHFVARLGWLLDSDERLGQSVVVPAEATALTLRAERCFVTDETGTDAIDQLSIDLDDADGAVLEVLANYSNLDAQNVCDWTPIQLDAASAHAGETVKLVVHGTSDGANVTSFYLDTLSLEARLPPVTPPQGRATPPQRSCPLGLTENCAPRSSPAARSD